MQGILIRLEKTTIVVIGHILTVTFNRIEQLRILSHNLYSGTSTILVPTGDQDPTVHLTQSFWMVVAPPILVANQI